MAPPIRVPQGQFYGTMAARIRAATNDGQLMIDCLTDIIRDERTDRRTKIEAARTLWDRAYGKALETSVAITGALEGSEALQGLGADQLVSLIRKLAAPTVEALPAPDPQPEVIASAEHKPEEQAALTAVDPDSAFGNLG